MRGAPTTATSAVQTAGERPPGAFGSRHFDACAVENYNARLCADLREARMSKAAKIAVAAIAFGLAVLYFATGPAKCYTYNGGLFEKPCN